MVLENYREMYEIGVQLLSSPGSLMPLGQRAAEKPGLPGAASSWRSAQGSSYRGLVLALLVLVVVVVVVVVGVGSTTIVMQL